MGCVGAAGRSVRGRSRCRPGVPRSTARRRGSRSCRKRAVSRVPPIGPMVVVDPLDGSTNASRGVPWFGTALCLVDDGRAGRRRASRTTPRASGSRRSAVTGLNATVRRIAVSACETLARCHRRGERTAGPPLRLGAVPRPRCLGARHLRRGEWRARRLVRHEPRRPRRVGLPRIGPHPRGGRWRRDRGRRTRSRRARPRGPAHTGRRRHAVSCSTPCSRNGDERERATATAAHPMRARSDRRRRAGSRR